MFNVTRPQPGPDCSKDYRSKKVISALEKMFFGKCYLCECIPSDPVVEHLDPHEGDEVKKYDWHNLYYACPRCNGIKKSAKDILNCCDASVNVSKAIKCLCPSVPKADITVEAQHVKADTDNLSVIIKNTEALLHKCYNAENTGIQSISKEFLHEKLFDLYTDFLNYRRTLKSINALTSEKANAKEHLSRMAQDDYPFSIFWKWHIWSDSFLEPLFDETG